MREHRQDARRTRNEPEPDPKPAKRELDVGKITGVMALDMTDAQLAEYQFDVGKVPRARVRQIDRRADTASVPERVDDILAKLDDIRGGQRLPVALAKRLAAELDADLSDVRVHTGGDAADMAARLGARALAVGSDIYFAAGAYDPDSPAGVELIAHEVAHVAQQQRAEPIGVTRVSRPDDAHERDADRFASAFVVGAKTPAVAPAPAMISRKPATGGDVWDELFGEPSKEVNKDARVSAPKGIILKVKPSPSAAAAASKLELDSPVTVARTTTQAELAKRWAYVTAAGGTHGFIEERYLLIDPPEPTAHVHRVKAGETLGAIARDTYGSKIEEGNDERLYVQAIYEANKGRPGIYLTEADIDTTDKIARGDAEKETLKIYKGVKAKADHALWVPSDTFVQAMKATGKITSGSTGLRPAWDAVVSTLDPVPEIAKMKAGAVLGIFEGAYQAIVDIFKGAVEMVKLAVEIMRLQMTGEFESKMLEVAQKLWDFVTHVDARELATKLGDYIANKWNRASWFHRGEMIGEVVGYIGMNVLLALLTEGGSLGAVLGEAAEAGSDIAKLVMGFVKVVDVAQNPVKLLEGAGKGVVIGEDAAKLRQGLKDAEKAREVEKDAAKAGRTAKTTKKAVSIEGFAQRPKLYPWTANPDGVTRSIDQAREIAKANGVHIPEDIQLIAVDGNKLPEDTYAQYLSLKANDPNELVSWEKFYNRFEQIPVKVSKEVLRSDEAIVAVMAHEMHELNSLREIFEARGGSLPAQELRRLIVPGRPGNLHDQAWDAADKLVGEMRSKKP